jgi:hypothetical protein
LGRRKCSSRRRRFGRDSFFGTVRGLDRYVVTTTEDERNQDKHWQFIRKAIRPSSRVAFSFSRPMSDTPDGARVLDHDPGVVVAQRREPCEGTLVTRKGSRRSGHAAAACPSSEMNSRRLRSGMNFLPPAGFPDVKTS